MAPVEITGMEFEWVKMPYDYVAVLQVSFVDDPANQMSVTGCVCIVMENHINGLR